MRIDKDLIEDALNAVECLDDSGDAADAADVMEAIKDAIKELAVAAKDIAESMSRLEGQRAEGYWYNWYAHIVGALDDSHGYLGGSMITLPRGGQVTTIANAMMNVRDGLADLKSQVDYLVDSMTRDVDFVAEDGARGELARKMAGFADICEEYLALRDGEETDK